MVAWVAQAVSDGARQMGFLLSAELRACIREHPLQANDLIVYQTTQAGPFTKDIRAKKKQGSGEQDGDDGSDDDDGGDDDDNDGGDDDGDDGGDDGGDDVAHLPKKKHVPKSLPKGLSGKAKKRKTIGADDDNDRNGDERAVLFDFSIDAAPAPAAPAAPTAPAAPATPECPSFLAKYSAALLHAMVDSDPIVDSDLIAAPVVAPIFDSNPIVVDSDPIFAPAPIIAPVVASDPIIAPAPIIAPIVVASDPIVVAPAPIIATEVSSVSSFLAAHIAEAAEWDRVFLEKARKEYGAEQERRHSEMRTRLEQLEKDMKIRMKLQKAKDLLAKLELSKAKDELSETQKKLSKALDNEREAKEQAEEYRRVLSDLVK